MVPRMSTAPAARRPHEQRDHRALEGPIRQFLADRGMTVTQLAEAIGVNRSVVSAAINGTPMSHSLGKAIAAELGVRNAAVMEAIEEDGAA